MKRDETLICSICNNEVKGSKSGGIIVGTIFVAPCCENLINKCPQIIPFKEWAQHYLKKRLNKGVSDEK